MIYSRSTITLLLLLALSAVFYALFHLSGMDRPTLFVAVAIINSFLFVLVWLLIQKETQTPERFLVGLCICFGILSRISLLSVEPIASDDIYRYLWDGKVQAHGLNPYEYAPDDSVLSSLHSTVLPEKINFPHMKTVYPPFAEWVFLSSYAMFGESITGFKVLIFLSEAASIWLLLVLMSRLRIPQRNIALYALCPLPIMQFMIDGHLDALGFPLLLAFLLLWFNNHKTRALLSYALAALVKLFPFYFLPSIVSVAREKGIRVILIPLVICFAAYVPYVLSHGSPFESLGIYTTNWTANSLLLELTYWIFKDNQIAHYVMGGLSILYLGIMFAIRAPLLRKMYLTMLGMLLLSPTVHVWYVTWIALLLPLYPRWSGVAFVALVSLATFPVIKYIHANVWSEPFWITILEYVVVIALFVAEELKSRRERIKLHTSPSR